MTELIPQLYEEMHNSYEEFLKNDLWNLFYSYLEDYKLIDEVSKNKGEFKLSRREFDIFKDCYIFDDIFETILKYLSQEEYNRIDQWAPSLFDSFEIEIANKLDYEEQERILNILHTKAKEYFTANAGGGESGE